jgi:hypothetical protein
MASSRNIANLRKTLRISVLENWRRTGEDIEDQRAEELENVERENQLSTLITSEN